MRTITSIDLTLKTKEPNLYYADSVSIHVVTSLRTYHCFTSVVLCTYKSVSWPPKLLARTTARRMAWFQKLLSVVCTGATPVRLESGVQKKRKTRYVALSICIIIYQSSHIVFCYCLSDATLNQDLTLWHILLLQSCLFPTFAASGRPHHFDFILPILFLDISTVFIPVEKMSTMSTAPTKRVLSIQSHVVSGCKSKVSRKIAGIQSATEMTSEFLVCSFYIGQTWGINLRCFLSNYWDLTLILSIPCTFRITRVTKMA